MELLLIVRSPLCLLGNVKINFCHNFERYDLTNEVTSAPKLGKVVIIVVNSKILQLKVLKMLSKLIHTFIYAKE